MSEKTNISSDTPSAGLASGSAQMPHDDRRRRFEAVCGTHRKDLLRFAFWLSHDATLAEDVVQETLIRAWEHFDSLADERAVRRWLLTIARRELARLFQRKRLQTTDIDNLSMEDAMQLSSADPQDHDDLHQAMLNLEESFREPLLLQVLFGYSTSEIADQLGLNQATVLTRLFRAREKLRASLEPDAADDT